MLRNEKYVGDVMLQKTFVDNLFEGKQFANNGELDRVLIQNHHRGIVDATSLIVPVEMAKCR